MNIPFITGDRVQVTTVAPPEEEWSSVIWANGKNSWLPHWSQERNDHLGKLGIVTSCFNSGDKTYYLVRVDGAYTSECFRSNWIKKVSEILIPTWEVLKPVSMSSTNGATLTAQEDGSILVSGLCPEMDVYKLDMKTGINNISAIRLEVLPDVSLPARGPGRSSNGNFVLTKIVATVSHSKGAATCDFRDASANFSQDRWPVISVIGDSKKDGEKNGWAIAPQAGREHAAIFELQENIDFTGEINFRIGLVQDFGNRHTIGKFRISVRGVSVKTNMDFMREYNEVADDIKDKIRKIYTNVHCRDFGSLELGVLSEHIKRALQHINVAKYKMDKDEIFKEKSPMDWRSADEVDMCQFGEG